MKQRMYSLMKLTSLEAVDISFVYFDGICCCTALYNYPVILSNMLATVNINLDESFLNPRGLVTQN